MFTEVLFLRHGDSRATRLGDPMARRFQRFSLRFVFEVTFVLGAGLAGYQASIPARCIDGQASRYGTAIGERSS